MTEDSDFDNGALTPDEFRRCEIELCIGACNEIYDRDLYSGLTYICYFLDYFVEEFPSAKNIVDDFQEALGRYYVGDVRTLDEAFGVYGDRKGVRLADFRFRRLYGGEIYERVDSLVHPTDGSEGLSRDEAFAEVAKNYPKEDGVIRDIYYEFRRAIRKYRSRKTHE